MYCNHCGTTSPNNSRFCIQCGAPLSNFNQPQNHQPLYRNTAQNSNQWNQMYQGHPQIPPVPKKKKRGCGCFFISLFLLFVLGVVGLWMIPEDVTYDLNSYTSDELMSELSLETYITAELYRDATLKTLELYSFGPNEIDLETWQIRADEILDLWELIEQLTVVMEETADKVIMTENKENALINDFWDSFVSYGLTKQDVNAIYDNAPKGSKLKTLAKQLNVSAKDAFNILKSTNNEIAKTWNNKADTYQSLENGARAIKSTSKAVVFVGGMVATGGASTLVEAGIIAVTGADLVMEIGEDFSIIQYGDGSKQAKSFGSIRKVTEPLASIIGLTGLKGLLKGKNIEALGKQLANLTGAERNAKLLELGVTQLDYAGAILMTVDQTSSYMQDNKVLGISLDKAKENQTNSKGTVPFQADVMTKDQARSLNINVDFHDNQVQPYLPVDDSYDPNESNVPDSNVNDSNKPIIPEPNLDVPDEPIVPDLNLDVPDEPVVPDPNIDEPVHDIFYYMDQDI